MHRKLEKRFITMESSLNEMIVFLDGLSEDQLHHKVEGKWSPAQVFQHLHDSEKGTIAYLSKKLQAPISEVPMGGLNSLIRSKLLTKALRSRSNQFRAPKVLSEIRDKPDYTALKESYLEVRKEMKQLLSGIDEKQFGRAYFRHPRAGRLTISQTLGFLEDH
jgi:hypothetical protein